MKCCNCGKTLPEMPQIQCTCGTVNRENGICDEGRIVFVREGVGTEIRRLLKRFGVGPGKGCGCVAREARYNTLGPDGCRAALREIAAELHADVAAGRFTALVGTKKVIQVAATPKRIRWAVEKACRRVECHNQEVQRK